MFGFDFLRCSSDIVLKHCPHMLLMAPLSVQNTSVSSLRLSLPDQLICSSEYALKPAKTFMLRSGEVEAVKVHHLVPSRYKVIGKLLLGVCTCIDFRQSSELGV